MKKIYLNYAKSIGTIAPEVYGSFSEHIGGVVYDGIYVGKDSKVENVHGFRKYIIDKLKAINAPVIRWPGGCFAEIYNWRDGIGHNRPVRTNWWTTHDKKYESNEVGTNEFVDFCELVGAKPYFAANLTSSTPLNVMEWVDYCLSPEGSTTLAKERAKNGHPAPFDIPFWGVGNENWGGGGSMRPEYYADEYRRYYTVMSNIYCEKPLEFYACGSDGAKFDWTHGVMSNLASGKIKTNGFAMHYYCGSAGDCLNFNEDEWYQLLVQASDMEGIILRNWNIISAYGMEENCKLIVDEWGCWHPENSGPSKGANLFEQQCTMRDAVVAAITLNIFNKHADKVRMANVAQLVNNLMSLFLSGGDKCITTPTYHVFDIFKTHQGGSSIDVTVSENEDFNSSISVSASVKDGKTTLTVANISATQENRFTLESMAGPIGAKAEMYILSSGDIHDHNTFEEPDKVKPVKGEINPQGVITIPPASVVTIIF